MNSTDWIDLEEAANRLSGTTEEITCMVREGILGSLINREGELFVQAGEVEPLGRSLPAGQRTAARAAQEEPSRALDTWPNPTQ